MKTLFEALALVVLVVFIFLQGWRATLIPLCAVPVSLVGTFVLFPLFGFSINTLSLFGLVLAIGLVVDDAIVVVEAVERHIEEGMSPRDATLQAMREVSGPVIGIALVLSAVFIPTAFLPGITGRLYQQFALTIAISVIFSAFNALSLSPALSALLLRPRKKTRGPLGWFLRSVQSRFRQRNARLCELVAARHSKGRAEFRVARCARGRRRVFSDRRLPSGFLPEEDQGYVFLALQLPDAASLERTDKVCREIEDFLSKTPGVQYTTSVIGFSLLSLVSDTYSAFFFVTFKPWSERTKPEEQYDAIKARLNKYLADLSEGIAFAFPPPAIPGVGTSGGFQLRAGRSRGQRCRVSGAKHEDVSRRRAQASRAQHSHSDVPTERAAGFRQCRPRQSDQAGNRSDLGLSNAADVHGRIFRELLQPLRPNLANLHRGGRRLSHRCEECRSVFRSQRERRPRAARCYLNDPKHRRPGIHLALQRISLGPNQRRRRARLQLELRR